MSKKREVSPPVPTDLIAALEIFLQNTRQLGKNTPSMYTDIYEIERQDKGCRITPTSHQGLKEAKGCFARLQKAMQKKVTLTLRWSERGHTSAFQGRRSASSSSFKSKTFTSMRDLEKWTSGEGRSIIMRMGERMRWFCIVSL